MYQFCWLKFFFLISAENCLKYYAIDNNFRHLTNLASARDDITYEEEVKHRHDDNCNVEENDVHQVGFASLFVSLYDLIVTSPLVSWGFAPKDDGNFPSYRMGKGSQPLRI